MAQDINNKKLTLFLGIKNGIINILIIMSLGYLIVILQIPALISDPYLGPGIGFELIMYSMLVAPVLGFVLIPIVQLLRAKKIFYLHGIALVKLYFYDILFAFFTFGIFYIITFFSDLITRTLISSKATSYFVFNLIFEMIFSYVLVVYLFLRISKFIKNMNLENNKNSIS